MVKSLAELHEELIAAIKDLNEDLVTAIYELKSGVAQSSYILSKELRNVVKALRVKDRIERKYELPAYMSLFEKYEAVSIASIEELMGHQGYTLSDLSYLTEIDEQSLSKILHCGVCTSQQALEIAIALDVQPNEIEP